MSHQEPVSYRESNRSAFLLNGADPTREQHHSEQTAREIDQEIRRIIDDSLEKTRHILETRSKALRALAEALLEKEVIDMDELKRIIEANSPSPVIVPGTASVPKRSLSIKPESPEADAPAVES